MRIVFFRSVLSAFQWLFHSFVTSLVALKSRAQRCRLAILSNSSFCQYCSVHDCCVLHYYNNPKTSGFPSNGWICSFGGLMWTLGVGLVWNVFTGWYSSVTNSLIFRIQYRMSSWNVNAWSVSSLISSSFLSVFKIAESIALISSNRLESRSVIAFSSVKSISVSIGHKALRSFDVLITVSFVCPSDCLVVFQVFLGHFCKGVGTSFGDINQTELCMILCLFHSAKANRLWLVTYIMMTIIRT